jgi:methanethiol S-methyltransferase
LLLSSSFLIILFATGIYGLIHSLLASLKVKELAAAWLGAGYKWYRLIYNIFATISLLPVLALAIILPDKPIYDLPSPWHAVMLILQLIGAGISFFAAAKTGLGYLAGITQLTGTDEGDCEKRLETGGLYRFVRHPIYSGAILFLWASPQMTWNSMALKLAFTFYFIIGGMVEEKKLVAEFGDAYRAYRLRTPMLIPGLKKSV